VHNVGQETAEDVFVVATLYDNRGSVAGFTQAFVDGPLAAGAEQPITLEIAPPGGSVVDVRLTAQALRVVTAEEQ
jgi:hypothetical protein